MAKKSLKAKKPDASSDTPKPKPVSAPSTQPKNAEQQIKAIIERGRKKGYLTYDEMNEYLPEEAVSPTRLDSLLATLGEMGITLLDEADVQKRPDEGFEVPEETLEERERKEQLKEDELLEKQLIGEQVEKRIDDPIRMYLTQMGEIPLLSRKNEIALARKIELTRMAFRRKMLESDYCARNAIDILQQVYEGTLSFDRTMKINTAENLIRSVIKKRMPENIETVNKLIKLNQKLFKNSLQAKDNAQARKILKRLYRNRRKIATLLEELSLRTSRIQPMKNKLRGIRHKMKQLENIVKDGPNGDYTTEDIEVIKQELDGLEELVVETPKQLEKRLRTIDRVFEQNEQTKRDLSGANHRRVVSI